MHLLISLPYLVSLMYGHGLFKIVSKNLNFLLLINNRIINFTFSVLHDDKLYKHLISFLMSGKACYISQHFVITGPSIAELNASEKFSLFSFKSLRTAKTALFITICKYLISQSRNFPYQTWY